jgi:hypothetical protein
MPLRSISFEISSINPTNSIYFNKKNRRHFVYLLKILDTQLTGGVICPMLQLSEHF